MPNANQRYRVQYDRICEIVIGRMGMRVYFEQRDKPNLVSFKIFGAEGVVPMSVPVEELEHMSDSEIAASIRGTMGQRS